MPRLPQVFSFWRNLFHKQRVDHDLDEEVRAYLGQVTDEKIQSGLSPREARRMALIELGGVEQVKEQVREVRIGALLETMVNDTRLGFRMLRKERSFSAVAVLTMALGIGANTTVFSVVRAVLLSRLPYSDPDRLLSITESIPNLPSALANLVPIPDYLHWRDQNQVFETLASYGEVRALNLNGNGGLERIDAADVTWDFFPMLRVHPALGRNFLPEEDRKGGRPVVVLSHSLWQRRFGSDPNLVGKTITLNEKGYTVIGIMPEDFHFPADWSPEVFIPSGVPPNQDWDSPSFGAVYTIARLKRNVKLARARSDLASINRRTDKALKPGFPPVHDRLQVRIQTLHERLVGDVRPLLLILLGAVGFVLLLACANVANLQLVRSATREKEFAVRAAIGAGRWRLGRQLLVESLALAALGLLAGLILGAGGMAILRHLRPPNLPDLKTVSLDPWVLAFTAGIAVLAGILFGLAPVFVASGLDLGVTLKESRPSTMAGGAAQRLRALLMVSEVALSLILVTGAGLLIGSFVRLASVDPGFDREHVLTERVMLPLEKYPNPAQWASFFQTVRERIGALPGVESAAMATGAPLTDGMDGTVQIEGRPAPSSALFSIVNPSYFHTLRIPLISGRDFTAYDANPASRVAIVSELFARRNFGRESPLGHRFDIAGDSTYSIVGVVRSTRHLPLTTETSPEVYNCYLQHPFWSMTLIVRAASDPVSLAAAVRGKVREVDPNQTVYDVATMEQRFSRAVAPQRFNALVMAIFAGIAVALAAVGVYGVMAYTVSRRTHEIGIRRALGAQQKDILRLVIGRGLWLVIFGISLGIAGALALTRLLSSLLYGVTSRDPLTFIAVSLILAGVALIAGYIPARRATRVDPLVALRYE